MNGKLNEVEWTIPRYFDEFGGKYMNNPRSSVGRALAF